MKEEKEEKEEKDEEGSKGTACLIVRHRWRAHMVPDYIQSPGCDTQGFDHHRLCTRLTSPVLKRTDIQPRCSEGRNHYHHPDRLSLFCICAWHRLPRH